MCPIFLLFVDWRSGMGRFYVTVQTGAVAKWNHSTISGGFEILKSQYIVVKIHFATAP